MKSGFRVRPVLRVFLMLVVLVVAGLALFSFWSGSSWGGARADNSTPFGTINTDRAREQGWDAAVVINSERVVLGLLRAKELDLDPDQQVSQAMRPAPSTFRPYVLAEEMAAYMRDHERVSLVITTSDGRLVGLLRKEDVGA